MTITEAARFLKEHDRFIVLTHVRPDGDAIGSACALCDVLRAVGKTAKMLYNPEITERYKEYAAPYIAEDDYEPDTVVSVDLASENLFPENAKKYLSSVDICIDHHPSKSGYAKNTCVDPQRAACGEIIYDIAVSLDAYITKEAAELLYIAISTDTGCFQYSNTNGAALRTAGLLSDMGADVAAINKRMFRTKSRSRMLIEGAVMSSMEFYYDNRAAVCVITREMMEKYGATENDMEDVASIPGAVEGVLCGVTIRELDSGSKASVRTTEQVNATEICAKLGGGGHAMASGCSSETMSVYELRDAILAILETVFE